MRREFLIEKEVLNVLRDAFCVELWTFYCKPKNFGPNVIYYLFVSAKKIASFKQDSFFFGSAASAGACRAFFATCESKAACKVSLTFLF